MDFKVLSAIQHIETIAVGNRIRNVGYLIRRYGQGRWLKRKGMAMVQLPDGTILRTEVHWYEASGIGRKEFKLKRSGSGQ